ncbi:Ger(x)C family spore germination protein [Paenibacillus yanchengensis]|uniref:Ger(X)C family spore germination protein n=1 Tax=Paenibacillus yanchengensis TaxID=2035833 RepID=A0ABW4YRJ0_9BACL
MIKKIILILLTITLSLSISGCKGSSELNEIHIIHSVGIDKGEKQPIRLTAEIAQLTASGQQPKGMQNNTYLLTSEGKSVFDAARLMQQQTERSLLWGHTTIIIFSKQIAKEGIRSQIDAIRRMRQIRNGTFLFVTERRASDILQLKSPSESIASQMIRGLSEGGTNTALTDKTLLIDVYSNLINEFKDITIPAINIEKDMLRSDKLRLQASGLYAFHGDRLTGLLNNIETKGLLRANNRMSGTVENITCDENSIITFENINNRSRVTVKVDNQLHPTVLMKIYADLNISSLGCSEMIVTPESIHKWEKKLNETIETELRQMIAFSNRHHADILGIGERIHRKYPKQWREMQQSWHDLYQTVEWKINVYTRIDHSNFIK